MKKFFTSMLALAAIAGFAPTASAQDEEPLIQFFVHGQPVKSGDRIDMTNYYNPNKGQYEPELTYVAQAVDDLYLLIDFYKNETPVLDDEWEYGADVTAQLCWPKLCKSVDPGKTLEEFGETVVGEEVDLQFHVGFKYGLGSLQTYEDLYVNLEVSLTAQFDEEEVKLVFYVDKPTAGVEGIEADSNAAPVYYDLQGRQVANPSNGLYIVKQGSKVSKTFLR